MEVKIYLGDAQCTQCGKKHKKIFEIDGKPYGSSCANELLGKNLTAPVWLYELAENWIKEEFKFDYTHLDEIAVNFFNQYDTGNYKEHRLWEKPVKVNAKSVKVDWQFEINDYIMARYKQLRGIE